MNILHASTDPNLLTRLREMLDSSARADIAVGYFFMPGFGAISAELSRLDKVRILVGRADRQVIEAVAAGLQQPDALKARLESDGLVQRRERTAVARDSVGRVADGVSLLPQTRDSQHAVSLLRDMVASGKAEVRAYRRSPLHAKAYLCWYDHHAEPGSAVVGSSNLTLAGFSGNTELNVRVTGDAEMGALRDWFEALWGDSEDISKELQVTLELSWALAKTPPYHVYLKALHELYSGGAGASELPLDPQDGELANFQLDAVRRGLAMIDIHGGCYVGDVVGLGKTFIGAELLRQLQFSYPNDGRPLILCPAGLKPMWESFNERFQLGAAVISHSMVVPSGETEFDEEIGRYIDAAPPERGIVLSQTYPDRGPVLVDEAHNFRNRNQRYAGLKEYLDSGDHKVVLLSATPQNLGPLDIYRQLSLFLDDTNHGLPIEPLDLQEYFGNAQRWLDYQAAYANYRAEFEVWERDRPTPTPPLSPAQPTVPRADITQVLSPLFIRRRRRDIRDLYGDTAMVGGQPVSFPEPVLENVDYRLDRVYARAGAFQEITDALEAHEATRYRASDYLLPAATSRPEYRGLLRARDRIAGLMKVLLLKRLESSVAAFRSTLETLINSNRNFRESLEAGFVPVGATATRLLAGQRFDPDELLEILQQEEARGHDRAAAYPAAHFNTAGWIADLDADYVVLGGLFERIAHITPEDDDKLRALREFLDQPEVRADKVLIFSEAETTIDYLYEQLNPGGRDPEIAHLSGGNRDNAEAIVARFSPRSNLTPGRQLPGPGIRVLLATDIVSEGQNLQDCARVLNYDLHWNPVRLIQRFGRVDRIGTEHDVIDLHNMWPDTSVDEGLELTERLGRRIQSFHDLIGLDNRLLSEAERLNAGAMYRIYGEKRMPEPDDGLDEVAAHQRAVALLQRIREDNPELWATITSLPDGIRSALAVQANTPSREDAVGFADMQGVMPVVGAPQAPLLSPANLAPAMPVAFDDPVPGETLVLLRAGDVHGCYAVGSELDPRPISPAQFVAAAECAPETPTETLPGDTNERVMTAFDAFRTEFGQRLGRARRPRNTRARRYVSQQLNLAVRAAADDPAEMRRLQVLRRILSGDLPPQVENALGEIRGLQLEGRVLRIRLEALRERYRLSVPDDSDTTRPPEPEVIRIVCSDGLIA